MASNKNPDDQEPVKKKSSGAYMNKMRAGLRAEGFVPRDVWVLPENSKMLRIIEKRLRQPLTADAGNLETLMSLTNTWNTKALHEALAADVLATEGYAEVKLVGSIDQSIQVIMNKHGDLPLFVAVNGEQILVEATLFPVSAINDVAGFNEMVLRSRSMFPLSALSIERDGNGIDQYVMYGALSAGSKLESIVTEIETLADNIINAAQAFESFYKQ
jgi:uncharacterized protein YjfI (DUF2170 family)